MAGESVRLRRLRGLDFTRRLLAAGRASGQDLFLAGGCLRDVFLGREPKGELDFTVADPARLLHRLRLARGESAFPLDEVRGTYRIFVGARSLSHADLARLRGPTISEDLAARDFTVNALALNLSLPGTNIIDPCGGLRDLRRRLLVCCAPGSYRDDPLRLMRGVRFSVTLGLRLPPETRKRMSAARGGLRRVAAERIRDELFQILQGSAPLRGLRELVAEGLLRHLGPAFAPADRLRLTLCARAARLLTELSPRSLFARELEEDTEWGVKKRGLLLLAAFLRDRGAGCSGLAKSLLLGGRSSFVLARCLEGGNAPRPALRDPPSLAAMLDLYRRGDAAAAAVILLAVAAGGGSAAQAQGLLRRYRRARTRFLRPALLSGKEALEELPVKPGPALGALLRAVREAQDLGRVASAESALALARRLLAN